MPVLRRLSMKTTVTDKKTRSVANKEEKVATARALESELQDQLHCLKARTVQLHELEAELESAAQANDALIWLASTICV